MRENAFEYKSKHKDRVRSLILQIIDNYVELNEKLNSLRLVTLPGYSFRLERDIQQRLLTKYNRLNRLVFDCYERDTKIFSNDCYSPYRFDNLVLEGDYVERYKGFADGICLVNYFNKDFPVVQGKDAQIVWADYCGIPKTKDIESITTTCNDPAFRSGLYFVTFTLRWRSKNSVANSVKKAVNDNRDESLAEILAKTIESNFKVPFSRVMIFAYPNYHSLTKDRSYTPMVTIGWHMKANSPLIKCGIHIADDEAAGIKTRHRSKFSKPTKQGLNDVEYEAIKRKIVSLKSKRWGDIKIREHLKLTSKQYGGLQRSITVKGLLQKC